MGYRDFTRDYITYIRDQIEDGQQNSVDQLKLGISPMFQLEEKGDEKQLPGTTSSVFDVVMNFCKHKFSGVYRRRNPPQGFSRR